MFILKETASRLCHHNNSLLQCHPNPLIEKLVAGTLPEKIFQDV